MNNILSYTVLMMALITTPLCAQEKKKTLNLNIERITVSGLSSGGYMANQFHLAFSDWVKGAGIIAAGPYFCAQNDINTALEQCLNDDDTPIDVDKLNRKIEQGAKAGELAALTNLKNDKVWLLHGTKDRTIARSVSDALFNQYTSLIPRSQISYVSNKPFAHLFPTKNEGGACSSSASPFIGSCNYDAAGEMLTFLLGDLNPPAATPEGKVVTFDQQRLAGNKAVTLADSGYAFVPTACAQGEACQVHVSFHGCNQYSGAVGMDYVNKTGLNNWADTNHLVIVYPQTKKSLFMPLNPQGCWDWWGYTGDDYASKKGEQLRAVKAIVQGLATN